MAKPAANIAKRAGRTRPEARAKALLPVGRAKGLDARDPATAGLVLDLLTNEIHRLKGAVGRGMYEVGVRLAQILDERLWQSRGYRSFEDYLEQGVSFSRSTGYKLIRIARQFNAELAERYGVEKLELGLRYLEATPERERPFDLMETDLRVRDRSGRFRSISFHEATPSQIRDAIHLMGEARASRRQIPEEWERRISELARALPPAPAGLHRSKRVSIKRGLDGRLALSFHAIALQDLAVFLSECERILNSGRRRLP
jgi:hypothetical protein